MTPTKFHHAGLDWIPHTPGDPMPCPPDTKVRVLLREEEDGRGYCDEQQRASTYDWIEFGAPSIIGWHPVEEQPRTRTEKGTGMTDEQINIKIAGLCGHPFETKEVCRRCRGVTPYEAGDDYGITIWEECRHCNNTGKVAPYHVGLPDYAADLNTCHRFEKTLLPDLSAYDRHLTNLCDEYAAQNGYEHLQSWRTTATARQRCEAFLRVQGKWEEEA